MDAAVVITIIIIWYLIETFGELPPKICPIIVPGKATSPVTAIFAIAGLKDFISDFLINGAVASLNSVAKIDYQKYALDGVSNTFTIIPDSLGKNAGEKVNNLVNLLDGYFVKGGHHLNVNVLNKETLIDAMNNPGKYPTLTIRVSGYAVLFDKLSRAHQEEVISRTFHERLGC